MNLAHPADTVLLACEESGRVRDAFLARKIPAISCDLLPTRTPGPHLVADIRSLLHLPWRAIIAFPPCTRLCSSGARWWPLHPGEQAAAIKLVCDIMAAASPRVSIENPIGVLSTAIRKPEQILQPWQFGHPTTKATCLWLRNLPPLTPTAIVDPSRHDCHHCTPGPHRSRIRSTTYQGIADAMARQWGDCL